MRPPMVRLWLRLALPTALALLACNVVQRQLPGWRPTATLPPAATRAAATAPPTATFVPTGTGAAATARFTATGLAAPTRAAATARPTATHPAATATAAPSEIRTCAYVPGQSTPATMPPAVLADTTATPAPLPTLPPNTPVDATVTQRQLRLYHQFWNTVNTEYVYPDFLGHDWKALGAKYQALIEKGLTDDAFYAAMDRMIAELGDDHSSFESPAEARQTDAAFQGHNDYTGLGFVLDSIPAADRSAIVYTFPGSPAAQAGLRAHDALLAVNGASLFDENGQRKNVIRGAEGTTVTLTLQHPGEPPFDLTLRRAHITGAQPIDACLMPTAGVAYIFLPSLDDATLPAQVRQVLKALTAGAPLKGLVLDNRENYGGAETVLEALLGFFVTGQQGEFVSRTEQRPLTIHLEEIGNSHAVPLIVLAGPNTVSYGEVLSGVLQHSGRARVVGQRTRGNVETLWPYDFNDGSRAWIAHETFQPLKLPNAYWEGRGIVPDVAAPTRWDLFTEATDPALAVAVQLLSK